MEKKENFEIQEIKTILENNLKLDKNLTKQIIKIFEKEKSAEQDEILKAIDKIENLDYKKLENHSEKFIKLIINLSQDIKTIIYLIVKYLYLIKNIEKYDTEKQKIIIQKVKNIYSPLAHRLGMYKIKGEFEERILKFEKPEAYNQILKKLEKSRPILENYIKNFIADIEKIIKPLGYKYRIKGRVKSVASIWKKMQRKQVEFEEVLDVFAIRIILDVEQEREIGACWDIFSTIQQHYKLHPKRIKDWLSKPKSNGYMSLHLTVLGPEERWVELQIRSERMDEIAENGLAAHWKYKEYSKNSINTENFYNQLKETLTKPVQSNKQPVLTTNEIYVYTPKGDIITLPKGSTILDFAFYIHSKIGEHCVGAYVNDKFVSYKYKPENGDTIKVIVSQSQQPKKEWLSLVKTSRAKRKIKQLLSYNQSKWIQIGRETIQRKLKKINVEYEFQNLEKIRSFYNLESITELFEKVGNKKIDLKNLKEIFIIEKQNKETVENFISTTEKQNKIPKNYFVSIEIPLKNVEYKIAKCCSPTIGDEIFVLKTVSGLVVHKTTCPNAINFINKNSSDRYSYGRWTKEISLKKFNKIKFRSKNKTEIKEKILKIAKNLNIPIFNFKITKNTSKEIRGYFITQLLSKNKADELILNMKKEKFFKIEVIVISYKTKKIDKILKKNKEKIEIKEDNNLTQR